MALQSFFQIKKMAHTATSLVLDSCGKVQVPEDLQKLFPCWIQLVPVGFKTDLFLVKVEEPLSNTGGTSVIAQLRKGKKCCAAAVRASIKKNVQRNNHIDTKISEEGARGGSSGTTGTLQPMERTLVKQVVPYGGLRQSRYYTAACGGPHTVWLKGVCSILQPMEEQAPGRNCSLWRGAQAGASGAPVHRTLMLEHSVPEGLYLMEWTHTGVNSS